MGQKKISLYSDMRVLCTILVVIGHCTFLYLTNKSGTHNLFFVSSVEYFTEIFRKIIYSFHMPLFVSLSGAVFSLTIKNHSNLYDFLLKKIKRLLVPFLLIGIFVLFPVRMLTGYYDIKYKFNILYIFFHDYILAYDVNYLWYLLMLFEISIVFYLFYYEIANKIRIKRCFILSFLFMLSFLSFLLPILPLQINKFFEFAFWFYIGFLINENRESIPTKKIVIITLIILWAVSFGVYSLLENLLLTSTEHIIILKIIKMIIRYIMEGAGVITLYSILSKYHLFPTNICSIIENNSMTIYLLHCPIIYIYKHLISFIPNLSTVSNFVYLLLLLIGILLSIIVSIVVGNIYRTIERKIVNGRKIGN